MKVVLANPRGFCAGVRRAIDIVERALLMYGVPIYVRHNLVHNDYVVNELSRRGVVFVDHVYEVPDGSVLIFSAHGVSKEVRKQSVDRNLMVFDATCPLVTKVHMEVVRANRDNMEVILIGHRGHPEVIGTMGQYIADVDSDKKIYLVESVRDARIVQVNCPDRLFFVTQTTLSIDDTVEIIKVLRQRFPNIIGPKKDDICYATYNRQSILKSLVSMVDMVLVVGSNTSSNSMRLVELVRCMKKPVYLVSDSNDIVSSWLCGINSIGVTAGASTPDFLVHEVVEKIRILDINIGEFIVEEIHGDTENVFFNIPKKLKL